MRKPLICHNCAGDLIEEESGWRCIRCGLLHKRDGTCTWNEPKPRTNADKIRGMSDKELREFLITIANAIEDFPWDKAIYEKHCKTCPGVILDGTEYHECDYIDGECPHGDTVDWWLKQKTKED